MFFILMGNKCLPEGFRVCDSSDFVGTFGRSSGLGVRIVLIICIRNDVNIITDAVM